MHADSCLFTCCFNCFGVVTAPLISTCTVSPGHDSGMSLRILCAVAKGTGWLKELPAHLVRKRQSHAAVTLSGTMISRTKCNVSVTGHFSADSG